MRRIVSLALDVDVSRLKDSDVQSPRRSSSDDQGSLPTTSISSCSGQLPREGPPQDLTSLFSSSAEVTAWSSPVDRI